MKRLKNMLAILILTFALNGLSANALGNSTEASNSEQEERNCYYLHCYEPTPEKEEESYPDISSKIEQLDRLNDIPYREFTSN